MKNISELNEKNYKLKLFSAADDEFLQYGRIVNCIDTSALISTAEKLEMPNNGTVYTASQCEFEQIHGLNKAYSEKLYGEMPVQIGFCYGYNSYLNGLEWHKGNEINVAVTDFVLLLGRFCDIKDGNYNSSDIKGFLIDKGTSVEIYSTTLHFCPCQTNDKGFKSVVILPKGTNLPLDGEVSDKYLFRKNKWIISHRNNASLIEKGVFGGINGENYKLNY